MIHISKNIARREFLKRGSAMTAFAGSSFAANLAMVGDASAQVAGDYKALVCIFLDGGNDQSNTVVPRSGTSYATYAAARQSLALSQASLLAITPQATTQGAYSGPVLGLHPQLTGLRDLFAAQKCAILANVATLVAPITKAQYQNQTVNVPLQLFSHSDQANSWQTGFPDSPSNTGWLGRAGDLMLARNGSSPVSICMSLAGSNVIQSGNNVIQYQLTTDGSVQISSTSNLLNRSANAALMSQVLRQRSAHMLENEYALIAKRSIDADVAVRDALANSVNPSTVFPTNNSLAAQLKMVARLIAARSRLQHGRQIFFVSRGGFDFHDNLLNEQSDRLGEVSSAIKAFYDATVELQIADKVTSFTASDFGRALLSNGRGADHGWGGHHFIVGGAVKGGKVYGRFPTVALGAASPEDAGEGRLIPTTSVDEYAAVLARWFGVTDMTTIMPQLGRFANFNMDFL
ncbi:MAG: DUF1501 domain-containing protein [Betaproteobacteria bacterium]|nr:MAG: DUF1501 domain-containing protein [Betaproteobacteria bacterium]